MPSRLGVVLILAFWVAVTGYVAHRELGPRYFGDAPPAIRIELSDEATQAVPAIWRIYRGAGDDDDVGTLTTKMTYAPADDTFQFTSTYNRLTFDLSGLRCEVPKLVTTLTVTRDGDLRGQSMTGRVGEVTYYGVPVPGLDRTEAVVVGVVENGFLVGRCKLTSPLGDLDQPLDPVPVPGGQVLNPLQPVSRLHGVRPGRRWVIHEVNPLADALAALAQGLLKKHAGTALANFSARPGDRPSLIAEVADRAQQLPVPTRFRKLTGLVRTADDTPDCWVIEYRGEQSGGKTWVRTTDGKVMLQEATGRGERLRLERED